MSKCCNKLVFVESGGEGMSYYVCKQCHLACDLKAYIEQEQE